MLILQSKTFVFCVQGNKRNGENEQNESNEDNEQNESNGIY